MAVVLRFLDSKACFYSLFVACCVALFWPGLVGSQVPVFRDAFHFYYPQAVWLDQCAQRGEYFPLWQPNEGFGVSVPGETTSALFYPLRVLWFIPGLTTAQRYSVVVIVHLLIAASGMVYACRRWGLRREAGWLAGAAYAFSCPVLFQHNNLVYLCSAAWYGFFLAETGCWLTPSTRDSTHQTIADRTRSVLVMSAALAVMLLSGDPHAVINCLLLNMASVTVVAMARRSGSLWRATVCRLAVSAAIAAGLSSVQWIPTLHWAASSHRWQTDTGPSVEEMDPTIPKDVRETLNFAISKRREARFDFSLPPWHLLTHVWPTLGGHYAPVNARAFAYISAEGRMWQPSLYFGLIPFLLLCRGICDRRRSPHRWLVFATAFALLAALGNYSLGWLVREALTSLGAHRYAAALPADHFSSLYGLLSECVPGYGLFRYPAKWSGLYIACGVLIAAIQLDQLNATELLRISRVYQAIVLLSLLGLVIGLLCILSPNVTSFVDALARPLSARVSDIWLGSPNTESVFVQIVAACLIPMVVIGFMFLVRAGVCNSNTRSASTKFSIQLTVAWIVLLESFVVATFWCSFHRPQQVAIRDQQQFENMVWVDTSEANIVKDKWIDKRSSSSAAADYQQQWLLGKLGLLSAQRNLGATLSIEPEILRRLRHVLTVRDNLTESQPELDVALAWLGIDARLIRQRHELDRASFAWYRITDPRPLCELLGDDEESLEELPRWQWLTSDRLRIELGKASSGKLLVRQFDDGGWQAMGTSGPLAMRPQLGGPFTIIEFPADTAVITLQRSRWAVNGGGIISLLTLGACAWRLRRVRHQSS